MGRRVRLGRRTVLTAALGVPGLLLLPALGGCGGDRFMRQRVAVPAYATPELPDGQAIFDALVSSAPATGIVVVNGPASAPREPYDPRWAATFRSLTAAGVRALAYVDTGYLGVDFGSRAPAATRADGAGGGRTGIDAWSAQIAADAGVWYELYGGDGLGGVFLDQTIAVCGPDERYARVYRAVVERLRAVHPGAYVVMNPGRAVERCFAGIADTLVTFEGTYRDYLERPSPDWERDWAPESFWHLVYGAPDRVSMDRAVSLSKARNAGYIYVTDDAIAADGTGHPWDTLPPRDYWQAELLAAFGPRPTETARG